MHIKLKVSISIEDNAANPISNGQELSRKCLPFKDGLNLQLLGECNQIHSSLVNLFTGKTIHTNN